MRVIVKRTLHSYMVISCIVAALVLCAGTAGASIASDFNSAWKSFHNLSKDSKRKKCRSNWEKIERRFRSIYKASPKGSYAPKSLYYMGRVNQELGNVSGRTSDYARAVDYFQRVVSRFPNHSWTDDCLYRMAEINKQKLNNTDQAYANLLQITHSYPKGDMAAKARKMLREMDKARAKSKKPSTPKPVVKAQRSSGKSNLERIRYQSSNDYTRIVLDLDGDTTYSYRELPRNDAANKPHRFFVDLKKTRLSPGVQKEIEIADGILRGIRAAQYDPETARVVIDLHEVQEHKIFTLFDPYRVVIDVYAPSNTSKLKQPLPVAKAKPSKPATNYTPPPGSKKHMGDLIEQLGLTLDTIMIDAGHGGKDPGAVANGLKEKDIVLKLAKIVGKKLQAKGLHVLYTRTTDKFIPLEERTAMANVRKADMFLSIHCNAHKNRKINGLETYSLNLARTKDAVRVAARENAVSTKRISDLQVILTDLMLNSKVTESKDLAKSVQKKTYQNVKRRKWATKDHGTREAPFYVLMGAKMPSILVEVGYLTNKTESKRLKSARYLDAVADGIVSGILAYKKQIERFASL